MCRPIPATFLSAMEFVSSPPRALAISTYKADHLFFCCRDALRHQSPSHQIMSCCRTILLGVCLQTSNDRHSTAASVRAQGSDQAEYYCHAHRLIMVARYGASDSEDHYILRMFLIFSTTRFFDIFETKFSKLNATWRGSSFNRIFAIRLPLRCPREQMRDKNPKFCRFSDRTVANLAPPFLTGEENEKSKTNVNH